MSLDGPALRSALAVGPALALSSYLVLMLSPVRVTDAMLVACMLWPTAAALLLALLPGDRSRWLAAGVGALLGTALAVAVIVALISGLAYLISDPA